jgi:cell division protein FtsW
MTTPLNERILVSTALLLAGLGVIAHWSLNLHPIQGDPDMDGLGRYIRNLSLGLVCYLGLRHFRPAWLKTYADASFYGTVALMMLCAFTPLGIGGMTYECRINLGFTTLNLVPLLWLTGLLFFGKLLTLPIQSPSDSRRHLLMASGVFLTVWFLVPEIGSRVMFSLLALGMTFYTRHQRLGYSLLGYLTLATAILAWLNPYKLKRLTAFLDPYADAEHTGYQLVQSLNAIQSGWPWGIGFAHSDTLLPQASTTFLLARLIEEQGALPIILILAVMLLLGKLGLSSFRGKVADYSSTIIMALLCFLGLEMILNVLQVTALMPKINITLPIAANRAESSVFTFVYLGILAALLRQADGNAAEA